MRMTTDIAILYEIVTAAQHDIENAPPPRPLPAAALFKAYDTVLPRHGIDPDTDHHISAFIFRIGGERGDATLVGKFQATLARMGIVLEHSDNTSAMGEGSVSGSRAESLSPPRILRSTKPIHGLPGDGAVQAPVELGPAFVPVADGHYESSSVDEEWEGGEVAEDGEEQEREDVYENQFMPPPRTNGWHIHESESRHDPMEHDYRAEESHDDHDHDHDHDHEEPFVERPPVTQAETQPSAPTQPVHDGQGPTASEARKAALISVFDRWRGLSNMRRPQANNRRFNGFKQQAMTQEKVLEVAKTHEQSQPVRKQGPMQPILEVTEPSITIHRKAPEVVQHHGEGSLEPQAEPLTQDIVPVEEVSWEAQPPATPPRAPITAEEEYARMMRRAARAREIWLASRAFNHWADRTARRLEREAVARRHMIRFRCFRAWAQMPLETTAAVDDLKAKTALQKLRRAVAVQEEQFRNAAQALASTHRRETIHRVLDRWTCHRAEHAARQKLVNQQKATAVTKWMDYASDSIALGQAIAVDKVRFARADALVNWVRETDTHLTVGEAARLFHQRRLSLACLRKWWDQAEAGKRAKSYRQYTLMAKAERALAEWNLRARAEAFVWRNEYQMVSRVFDKWLGRCQEDQEQLDKARTVGNKSLRTKYLRSLHQAHKDHSILTQRHTRVDLYISANRALDVLEYAMKRHDEQEKRRLKRILQAKYEQFSSAKKKRNFYAALDRWQVTAALNDEAARAAAQCDEQERNRRQRMVLDIWQRSTDEHKQISNSTNRQYAQRWLAAWTESTQRHEQQHLEAWDAWGDDTRHQYLKVWSIASMQQGGQAHTAAVAWQRHQREKRNQALKLWRQSAEPTKLAIPDPRHRTTAIYRSSAGYRNSWKNLATSRGLAKSTPYRPDDLASLIETPSRWTGSLLHGRRSQMDPVTEAEEVPIAEPMMLGDPRIRALQLEGGVGRGPGASFGYPSTTPRAPVPVHLNPVFDMQNAQQTRPGMPPSQPQMNPLSAMARSDAAGGRYRPAAPNSRGPIFRQSTTVSTPQPTAAQSQRPAAPLDMFAPVVKSTSSKSLGGRGTRLPRMGFAESLSGVAGPL